MVMTVPMEEEKRLEQEVVKGQESGPAELTKDSSVAKKAPVKEKRLKIAKSKLEALEKASQERDLYLDSLRRMKADFENYKKRVWKEREQLREVLTEDFILQLLPVVDNLAHALNTSSNASDHAGLIQGVELIYKQLISLLSSRNVMPMEVLGKPFDPNIHEALSYEESDAPQDQIIEEIVKGYEMNGRLLRPAKVKVSKGKPIQTLDPAS